MFIELPAREINSAQVVFDNTLQWIFVSISTFLVWGLIIRFVYLLIKRRISRGVDQPKAVNQPKISTPTKEPKRFIWQRIIQPVAQRKGTEGIFISYRRQDEPSFAGRLYDRLAAHFGRKNIFMDVDSIELGLDFAEVINRSLSQCKVLIVVIGKNWLRAVDAGGQPRLKRQNDYVRIEIETALRRNIRVIPIIVEGASMPKNSELPDTMASLSRRNGTEMSYARFNAEVDQLIGTLRRILK